MARSRVQSIKTPVDRTTLRIWFEVDPHSLLNGDSGKGILYSKELLQPLMKDLDGRRFADMPPSQERSRLAYKVMDSDWYLYLAFD